MGDDQSSDRLTFQTTPAAISAPLEGPPFDATCGLATRGADASAFDRNEFEKDRRTADLLPDASGAQRVLISEPVTVSSARAMAIAELSKHVGRLAVAGDLAAARILERALRELLSEEPSSDE